MAEKKEYHKDFYDKEGCYKEHFDHEEDFNHKEDIRFKEKRHRKRDVKC